MSSHTKSNFVISAAHILFFLPGKTPKEEFKDQDKTDVINSTLLAQLAVVSPPNSVEHASEWMNHYIENAAIAAWLLQSGSNFKSAAKDSISISIDHTVIQILRQKDILADSEIIGILEALLYLKGMNPEGLDILEKYSKNEKSRAFQLVVCEKKGEGNIAMKIMPFVYETTETVASSLFQTINDPDTYTLKYMSEPTILVLNLKQYDSLRDDIENKVKDYIADTVKYLPL